MTSSSPQDDLAGDGPQRSVPTAVPTTRGAGVAAPYDAVLLLSFGGPEAPEEVMPFLENVTRGRGIPPQRLELVARHYHHRGGRSPINDCNRALLAALRAELDARDLHDLPLYWGNRNWRPYLVDALREAHEHGHRRLAVVLTSAYSSYSGCRQYRENLADALAELTAEGRTLEVDKIRPFFGHPGFTTAVADAVQAGLAEARTALAASPDPADVAGSPRLVYVTHSIPTVMNDTSGSGGGAYLAQHRAVAAATAPPGVPWDLVFCSRSGPPTQPWLEPDVEDHLRALAAAGERAVVVVPIGFVSDHMEVVQDLDTAAAAVARECGLTFVRAATVGTAPAFVRGLVDLVLERAAQARADAGVDAGAGDAGAGDAGAGGAGAGGADAGGAGADGGYPAVCRPGCCPNPRAVRPAACGSDPVVGA